MPAATPDPADRTPDHDRAGDRSAVDWASFGAVLFDLDGVVTPTATIHERAWAELFAPWGFTQADYLRYVDGKPRYDGVRSFLESRGVELPWGSPDDPPGDDTICAMGNRKNDTFNAVLERDGIAAYPDAIDLLDLLDAAGVPSAIVSSSKNARTVLAAAAITDRFVTVVDGTTAELGREPNHPGLAFPDRRGQDNIRWCPGPRAAKARAHGFTLDRALAGRRQAALHVHGDNLKLTPLHERCATYVLRDGRKGLERADFEIGVNIGDRVVAGTTVVAIRHPDSE